VERPEPQKAATLPIPLRRNQMPKIRVLPQKKRRARQRAKGKRRHKSSAVLDTRHCIRSTHHFRILYNMEYDSGKALVVLRHISSLLMPRAPFPNSEVLRRAVPCHVHLEEVQSKDFILLDKYTQVCCYIRNHDCFEPLQPKGNPQTSQSVPLCMFSYVQWGQILIPAELAPALWPPAVFCTAN
jgi:hypothetical protein